MISPHRNNRRTNIHSRYTLNINPSHNSVNTYGKREHFIFQGPQAITFRDRAGTLFRTVLPGLLINTCT